MMIPSPDSPGLPGQKEREVVVEFLWSGRARPDASRYFILRI
jgi:hypothetical protein